MKSPVLIVPPLSGHFAALLRDMVVELSCDHDVHVIDWTHPRSVPVAAGAFSMVTSVDCVLQAIDACPSPPAMIGLCQGAVTGLLAAGRWAKERPKEQPGALILIAGPIDAFENLSGTATVIRAFPLSMYQALQARVPVGYPGVGRAVFPAVLRAFSMAQYAMRHAWPFDSLLAKFIADDGANPDLAPFCQSFFSTMDLHADWLVETLRRIYFEAPAEGLWAEHAEELESLSCAVLLTIEGALDDVAAPGQTHAAQRLCSSIPTDRRFRETIANAGHFDLFHGNCWRQDVAPLIRKAIRSSRGATPLAS